MTSARAGPRPDDAAATEENIDLSEERYRLASEAADLGTWRRDGESDVLVLDARAQRHFGVPEPTLTVAAALELIHPDDRDGVRRAAAAARDPAASDGRFTMEYRVVHADGGTRWLSVRARLLFAGAPPLRALRLTIGTSRDITAQKLADETLRESEARYATLVQHSPDAIFVNRDDQVTYVNARCLELFGAQRPEDLLGRPVPELFAAGVRGFVATAIARLRSTLEPSPPIELEIIRFDGRSVPVEVSASPFREGGAVSLHVVLRDITSLRLANRELRQWADAFRSCWHGIAMADPATDRLLACNPAFARMLGLSVSELIGTPSARIHAPQALAEFEARIAELGRRNYVRYQAAYQRADGSTFPVEVDLVIVRDESGAPLYRIATVQDITERRARETEIERLHADLERRVAERTAELAGANEELASFAYAVSHDLRAPLRAMSGFSHALIEDFGPRLDREARGFLEEIIQASRRMGELIDGLLLLSRVTRGELRREPVALSAMAERLLREFSASDTGRQVDWEVQPGLTARGDARLVEIVLRNLLGNAWKYTSRTPAARIRVSAQPAAGGPAFCVEDNGAGFDMEHSQILFQPFQRLHRQDEFPGLGIGLATVARIVRRHGGVLAASGEPGRGARFTFSFAGPEG